MKLFRFGAVGVEKPGLMLTEGRKIDAASFGEDYNEGFFETGGLGRLAAWAAEHASDAPAVTDDVRIGSPVARPSKIICIGLNYADHAAEIASLDWPSLGWTASYAPKPMTSGATSPPNVSSSKATRWNSTRTPKRAGWLAFRSTSIYPAAIALNILQNLTHSTKKHDGVDDLRLSKELELTHYRGKDVKLKFTLQNAKLHAFEIKNIPKGDNHDK